MAGQAVDTNILAYDAGLRRVDADEAKIVLAGDNVDMLIKAGTLVIPAQVLAELHHVLQRKGGYPASAAQEIVEDYASVASIVATDIDILGQAFALSADHGLQTYDAIILAAAAGCDTLYSEDMQAGFVWGGVRIVNPFA